MKAINAKYLVWKRVLSISICILEYPKRSVSKIICSSLKKQMKKKWDLKDVLRATVWIFQSTQSVLYLPPSVRHCRNKGSLPFHDFLWHYQIIELDSRFQRTFWSWFFNYFFFRFLSLECTQILHERLNDSSEYESTFEKNKGKERKRTCTTKKKTINQVFKELTGNIQ